MKMISGIALGMILLTACNGPDSPSTDPGDGKPTRVTPVLAYTIGAALPHDTSYFTEGLEFYNGTLLESTGLKGKSKLVQREFPGGRLLRELTLDASQFGEGLTVVRDTIYQLTYQEHTVNVYTAKDFKKVKVLPFNTEGWGLTNDGRQLIATDGSSNLYFYEPSTFRLLRVQAVTENDVPAVNLNELEYVNGFVYANQWQYNYILKIDPNNGQVVAKMDLSDLVRRVHAEAPGAEVLNGIAYNPQSGKLYVTGKNWPQLFELVLGK